MQRFRDLLTPWSRVKYLAWRGLRVRLPATFRLSRGGCVHLRPEPATDVTTAYEIFVAQVYRSVGPDPDRSVRRVVDVGANVGMSVLFWAARYPNAQIVAFEPHPAHIASLRRNVARNGIAHRVAIHAAAACRHAGTVALSDAEHESSTVGQAEVRAFDVPAIDFFEVVGRAPVDLLKMDIEGGEYDLLSDPRFADLDVDTIVMEWHQTPRYANGRDWCESRLSQLGFAVRPGLWSSPLNGLLWGYTPRGLKERPTNEPNGR